MSMPLWECLMIVKLMAVANCAPKIGHVLFDPLIHEANKFDIKPDPPITPKDALKIFNLRSQDKPEDNTIKPYVGYDYDDTLCKLLGDRIICGYNKNVGEPKDDKSATETEIDGCRIRGDRLECGYFPPFIYSRRPPANISKDEHKIARQNPSVVLAATVRDETIIETNTTEDSNTNYSIVLSINKTSIETESTTTTSSLNNRQTNTRTTSSNITNEGNVTSTHRLRYITPNEITALPTNKPTGKTEFTNTTTPSIIFPNEAILLTTKLTKFITEKNRSNKIKFKCVDSGDRLFCYELT